MNLALALALTLTIMIRPRHLAPIPVSLCNCNCNRNRNRNSSRNRNCNRIPNTSLALEVSELENQLEESLRAMRHTQKEVYLIITATLSEPVSSRVSFSARAELIWWYPFEVTPTSIRVRSPDRIRYENLSPNGNPNPEGYLCSTHQETRSADLNLRVNLSL